MHQLATPAVSFPAVSLPCAAALRFLWHLPPGHTGRIASALLCRYSQSDTARFTASHLASIEHCPSRLSGSSREPRMMWPVSQSTFSWPDFIPLQLSTIFRPGGSGHTMRRHGRRQLGPHPDHFALQAVDFPDPPRQPRQGVPRTSSELSSPTHRRVNQHVVECVALKKDAIVDVVDHDAGLPAVRIGRSCRSRSADGPRGRQVRISFRPLEQALEMLPTDDTEFSVRPVQVSL